MVLAWVAWYELELPLAWELLLVWVLAFLHGLHGTVVIGAAVGLGVGFNEGFGVGCVVVIGTAVGLGIPVGFGEGFGVGCSRIRLYNR